MKTFFIGLNFDRYGNPIPTRVARIAILSIKRAAVHLFGGYSLSVVDGGYVNAAGKVVEEKTLRVEIATHDNALVVHFAATCARLLNQESVLVSSPGAGSYDEFVKP